MEQWQPYLIAALIGLLTGIERERARHGQQAMGVRTFVLIGLLGAVAKGCGSTSLSLMIAAFAFALIAIAYFNQTRAPAKKTDRGLTTEFAAGLVFCLGYAAADSPVLAALVGPMTALILFSKAKLHRFTRTLKSTELEAALLLFLGAVVVISLLPNTTVDPWGVFHLKKLGYLILILAILEFASYACIKLIGEKKGAIMLGFLGGVVSSTAVLISSSKMSHQRSDAWRNPLCSVLSAIVASLLELILILGLISTELLLKLLPAVMAGLLVLIISLLAIMRGAESHRNKIVLRSPLDWSGVLRLSLLLATILGAISLAKHWLGESATLPLSFLGGLFELHGVCLANATMFAQGQLPLSNASINVFLATLASLLAKAVLGGLIGRGRFARVLANVVAFTIIVACVVARLTL